MRSLDWQLVFTLCFLLMDIHHQVSPVKILLLTSPTVCHAVSSQWFWLSFFVTKWNLANHCNTSQPLLIHFLRQPLIGQHSSIWIGLGPWFPSGEILLLLALTWGVWKGGKAIASELTYLPTIQGNRWAGAIHKYISQMKRVPPAVVEQWLRRCLGSWSSVWGPGPV